MYRFGITDSQPSSMPWEISFDDRYQLYVNSVKEGKKVNLYFYERADSSTFRYRAYNIFEALQMSNESWRSFYFFNDEISQLLERSPKASLFTIVRVRWCLEIQSLISYIKKNQWPLIFDIDDLVFDTNDLPMVCDTSSVDLSSDENLTQWFGWFSRINETAKHADALIATNQFLAQKLNDYYHRPAYVIRNFMNEDQICVSKKLCEIKEQIDTVYPFCIGYFSGSYSHNKDFASICDYLYTFMERHDDVVLKIVGHLEIDDRLKTYEENGRILWLPYMDFKSLQREIASVDINVIPLMINDFTNCKSELKFFEASIVKTITCASKTYIYEQVLDHNKTGYLCEGEEWLSAFEDIYQNKQKAKSIAENAYKKCFHTYFGDQVIHEIVKVYDAILDEVSK